MTFFECCETVRAKGLHMIRPFDGSPGQYEMCEPFENEKDWTWLDAVTANVVCQVHDVLYRRNIKQHTGRSFFKGNDTERL